MKPLGFAILLAFVGLTPGSTACCSDLYVTLLSPTGVITARQGTTIEIPISVDYSTAQSDATDNIFYNNMSGFDLVVSATSSMVSLPSTFVAFTPGSDESPSFLSENPDWFIQSQNPANGKLTANADSSDGINDVAAMGTLPTLNLFLHINGTSTGMTTVTISGLNKSLAGSEYPKLFDIGTETEMTTNGPIQLNVIAPEPGSFSLLVVALAVGGGLLAVRRWRRTSFLLRN